MYSKVEYGKVKELKMWLELAAKIYVISLIVGIIVAACVIVGATIWFCCKKDD